ncbi:hypothetical protein [Erwinia piriflorinigrans]|uniref:Uncharacterized protein n=1 Tax=Erwinia piriflorinigrans CFBP 5888 TaxID=1161919 RepID=V5Z8V5_9GAMM|nr:hypothetical protein [Erwinia piriflorinigrans]CCG87375.1 hypothetical protein EPIR_2010 [Erwinia piriflorinigrans CFBP 5888]
MYVAALTKRSAREVSMSHVGFCKTVEEGHIDSLVKIPSSWDISKLQRGFIESMFEDKK